MSEFNLSNTPNASALIITRGEVQDNHAVNFAKVLQYGGEVAMVSTVELEHVMPTLGVALSYRGDYAQMRAQHNHRQECASWIAEHVLGSFGLNRFSYDVHLLDGAPNMPDSEGFDGMRPHWHGIARYLTERQPHRWDRDGGGGVWTYEPFRLVDKQLEGLVGGDLPETPTIQQLVEALQAARLPVRFNYATASLLPDRHGDLRQARVTFTYPTLAKFERSWAEPTNTRNADGDRVLRTTQISSRTYSPPVSVESQIALDDAIAAGNRTVREAIERHGDDLMFMMADDGTTDYNNEARLAPIYNLL